MVVYNRVRCVFVPKISHIYKLQNGEYDEIVRNGTHEEYASPRAIHLAKNMAIPDVGYNSKSISFRYNGDICRYELDVDFDDIRISAAFLKELLLDFGKYENVEELDEKVVVVDADLQNGRDEELHLDLWSINHQMTFTKPGFCLSKL